MTGTKIIPATPLVVLAEGDSSDLCVDGWCGPMPLDSTDWKRDGSQQDHTEDIDREDRDQ